MTEIIVFTENCRISVGRKLRNLTQPYEDTDEKLGPRVKRLLPISQSTTVAESGLEPGTTH